MREFFVTFIRRLAALFRRRRLETDLDEELRSHLEMAVDLNLRRGMSADDARREALRSFGGVEQTKEIYREQRGLPLFETLMQDTRYGLRMLAKSPAFTSVVILTLGLGIGANTAIFSLIDTVMLRMLPVQKPEELVQVLRLDPSRGGEGTSSFTNPLWEQIRDHQDVFSNTFAWSSWQFDLAQGGAVHNANGMYVSGSFFTALGVHPAAGRLITETDDLRVCPPVAALSYGFWQDHFGGASSAIGSTLSLNNYPFQVIGVSGPGFYGVDVGNKFDVAIPICAAALFDGKRSRLDQRSWWWLDIMGRVKPGISPDQMKAGLGVLSPEVFAGAVPQDWDPKDQQRFRERVLLGHPAATGISYLREQFGQPLAILMAVVGLVLLIACANIASLMPARAAARHKEIAVRKALGASRSRLIRQLLTECLLLSTAGALLGVLFARWGTLLLVRYISTAENQVFLDLSFDWRILGFTAAVAIFTGLLFGGLPAFRSTRVSLTSAMKGSQAEDGERRVRFRPGKWVVGSQVALSLVLLVVAGLFLRSFVKLATLDIGFDRNNVLLVNANLNAAKIPPELRPAINNEIETRLRALPGVTSVGRSVRTPVSNFEWNQYVQVDSPNPPKGEDALVYFNFISPGYFQTLRTPLLEGRDFNGDTKTSVQVAIVNETFARRFFHKMNCVGKYFKKAEDAGKPAVPVQIVGLVRDSKYESVREDTFAQAFFPASQTPEGGEAENFELRTENRPLALISMVQDAVAGVHKGISLDFHSLAEQVDDSLVQERLLATLSAFFGALALFLAMIGLYGALSYLVTQRQAEFGIRMALGAPQRSILALVMRDVLVVLAGGVAAGVCISLATVGVLQRMLFGLAARDTATLIASVGLLSAVAFFAGYLPARRALRLDPVVALRYE